MVVIASSTGVVPRAARFVLADLAVPGLRVIGVGALLNGLTIAVNGGTLPARPEARRNRRQNVTLSNV